MKTEIPFLAINLQQRAQIIQFPVQKKFSMKKETSLGEIIFPKYDNEGLEEVKKQKLVK